MEKLLIDDFYHYHMLSALRISPEGTKAAWIERQVASDREYTSHLWVLEDGQPSLVFSKPEPRQFVWFDDGHILFTGKSEDGEAAWTELYNLAVDRKEALLIDALPFKVEQMENIGNGKLLLLADINVCFPDDYKDDPWARETRAKKQDKDADVQIIDELPFWENGKGFVSGTRKALFLYSFSSKALTRITDPWYDVAQFTFLKRKIAYRGNAYKQRASMYGSVMVYDIDEGATRCLVEEDRYRCWMLSRWNEKLVVKLTAADDPMGFGCTGWFYSLDPETGECSLLNDYECDIGSTVSSDCRLSGGQILCPAKDSLYFITTRGHSGILLKLDGHGQVKTIFETDGSVDSFDVCPENGKIYGIVMARGGLQEIYEIHEEEGTAVQMTHFNDQALQDKYVAPCEKICFNSCGYDLEGFVLKPKDFDPMKRYPGILEIHGGPRVAYGTVFFHEMQFLANEGYFVFFCNPVGSDGGGFAFSHIHGKWGTVDYINLMDFADEVLRRYPQIDPERLGVTGGSYGGFMTNWIIGHTHRFRAAVSQRSIASQITSYGVSDIGYSCTWEETGGDMYRDFDQVWASSPLKYACHAITPTLFLHSDQDYRCVLAEGQQMFTALKDRGVPSKLFIFKGENHELSRSGQPMHRVRRLWEILSWMNQYLKNGGQPEKEEEILDETCRA